MVNRGHDGQARLLQIKNAICQRLVVVYDIKVLGMGRATNRARARQKSKAQRSRRLVCSPTLADSKGRAVQFV